jgi:SnoaL-like domain
VPCFIFVVTLIVTLFATPTGKRFDHSNTSNLSSIRELQGMSAPSPSAPLATVEETLDALHTAASNADLEAYFKVFAPNAIFLGTDLQERWTMPEFYIYAKPHFDQGQGWTYTPVSRNITYYNDNSTACFDEILHNDRFGMTRSSGVALRQSNQLWKIVQYHLTVPIPNHLMDTVVQIIKFDGNSGFS